jgi:hypothetical protein
VAPAGTGIRLATSSAEMDATAACLADNDSAIDRFETRCEANAIQLAVIVVQSEQ